LHQEDEEVSKPEGIRAKGYAEVVGNACAEGIGQRGEEEVEGAGEADYGRDWRLEARERMDYEE
jgi:hypothetical protein